MIGGLIKDLFDPSENACPVFEKAHTIDFKVLFCKSRVRKQNGYLNLGVSACNPRQIHRPDLPPWVSSKQEEVNANSYDGES